jgi:hypothetical protein
MSAQPAIDPSTTRPRWTPVIVPAGPDAPLTPAEVAVIRPATAASAWRRRLGAVAALVLLVFLVTVGIGRVTAGADPSVAADGTATVAPGQTLWDVATATAPAGVDARDQLARIVELNGLSSAEIDAWTVLLLPAR